VSEIKRIGRGAFAVAAVVGSLLAISATPAMAAVHWSDTTKGMRVSGTLTVAKEGIATTKTCTISSVSSEESTLYPNSFYVHYKGSWTREIWLPCSGGGTLGFLFEGGAEAAPGGGYQLRFAGECCFSSPWSGEAQFWQGGEFVSGEANFVGKFTNGSGTTPSKVTFSKTQIGVDLTPARIWATGSLNVTNASGGLLTLLP
jgi:hypothetical protein